MFQFINKRVYPRDLPTDIQKMSLKVKSAFFVKVNSSKCCPNQSISQSNCFQKSSVSNQTTLPPLLVKLQSKQSQKESQRRENAMIKIQSTNLWSTQDKVPRKFQFLHQEIWPPKLRILQVKPSQNAKSNFVNNCPNKKSTQRIRTSLLPFARGNSDSLLQICTNQSREEREEEMC